METRGFEVRSAASVGEGIELIRQSAPAFAVVDMRLEDGNGLDVIAELSPAPDRTRAIVLTGYGNFATAVSAVKLGAVDYLAKPADADDVTDALLAPSDSKAAPPENPMSADRVRWEHIQRVYELCDRNVSETARRLNMHRRTLQRILAARAQVAVRAVAGRPRRRSGLEGIGARGSIRIERQRQPRGGDPRQAQGHGLAAGRGQPRLGRSRTISPPQRSAMISPGPSGSTATGKPGRRRSRTHRRNRGRPATSGRHGNRRGRT